MNIARQKRGFRCDQCGKELIPGREIVLNNEKWASIVSKSKSQWEPKFTLLCPDCIEELNGGPLKLEDVLQERGGILIGIPINFWYMRKRGLPMFKYIRNNLRYHMESDRSHFSRDQMLGLWKWCRDRAIRIDS